MYIYTLSVMILMCAIQLAESSASVPPYVQHYSIESHLYYWELTKLTLPANRCLLLSLNTTSASIICDQLYNQTQMEDVLEITRQHKALVGNLDLSCALDERAEGIPDKICVCTQMNLRQDAELGYAINESVSSNNLEVSNASSIIEGLTFETCTYPTTLYNDMIEGYSKLRILNMHDIPIQVIQKDALNDVEGSLQVLHMAKLPLKEELLEPGLLCQMTTLHFVLMDYFSDVMNEFPTSMFTCNNTNQTGGLKSLLGVFANGNIFKVLPPFMVGTGANSLIVLNLTDNGIREVSEHTFENMKNLHELNLDNNNIEMLPTGLFSSLAALKYLSIQHNNLRYLDLSLFQPLRMVSELHLGGNRLYSVYGSFRILPSLRELYLQDNQFTAINATMFSGCYQLREINLNHNFIDKIDSKAFSSLLFLGKLRLGFNQLSNSTNLQEAFHGHLEHLKYLNLKNNLLTELLPQQFQKRTYLHRLQILDLSFNEIHTIDEDSFLDMDEMTMITLFRNNITTFHANTFRRLLRLQTLWIDVNQLEEMPDDALPPQLLWLSLGENNIRNIPYVSTAITTLQSLHMGYNNMSSLNSTMFTNFPNLKILNLTHCNLWNLDEATFDDLKDLEALDLSKNNLNLDFSVNYLGNIYKVSYLNLSNNAISSAENLFQHHVKYADVLDISSNPLNVFPDQPKRNPFGESSLPNRVVTSHIYVRNCSLTYINPKAFELLPNIVHMDFSLNNLHSLERLEIVKEVADHYFVFLYDNPIRCDCHASWLKLAPYNSHYKLSYCYLETGNELMAFDEVNLEQFLCHEVLNCLIDEASCACYTDNATHRTIIFVRCTGGLMSTIPRNIPPTSRILDFHGNPLFTLSLRNIPNRPATIELYLYNCSISQLISNQFKKFYLLELLDLSFNDISELQADVFLGLFKLQKLYLNHNRLHMLLPGSFNGIIGGLQSLTLHDNELIFLHGDTMATIDELPYLSHLSLYHNPWDCQCDNGTFKHWLQDKADILEMLNDIQCNYTDILTLPDESFICYDTTVYVERYYKTAVVTTSVIATILAVFLLCIIVCYMHKTLIFVLIYHRFGWRWDRKEDTECPYDGFIVYTNTTMHVPHWVRIELLAKLEPPYKMFISDRDSIPGRIRSEEIISTIKESRRTIFILSEDAIQDDFFMFTFHTAYGYINESDNHHRMIVIVMDDVDLKQQFSDPDLHLQAFIKTGQYIRQSDKRLWKKILYEMPDPPLKEELCGLHSTSFMETLPGFIHNELHCTNEPGDISRVTKEQKEINI